MQTFISKVLAVLATTGLCAGGTAVWTAQYNSSRTAENVTETTLTTANVNTKQFGLLFSRQVDGLIYAQPLYVPGVKISGKSANVVFVATMNNSVYAFDADVPSKTQPFWQINLGTPLQIVTGGTYIGPQIGILSTPVIDVAWNMMYVVSLTVQDGVCVYSLHAIDLSYGTEQFGGPVVIQGYVPGTAFDAHNGDLAFNSNNVMQRPGLLLYNGTIVIGFGALAENYGYHGWVFSYDAHSLLQTSVWCTSPNGTKGGIWQSGHGIASDANGMYFITGNGSTGQGDHSSEFVHLNGTKADYFVPSHYNALDNNDWDLNAGGPLLIPNTQLLLGGGKTGTIFVLNRTNLGGYASGNTQIVQNFQATNGCATTGTKSCDELHHYAYWHLGSPQPLLYVWPMNESLSSYAFNGTTFNTTPVAQNAAVSNFPGGQLAVSSNGNKPGTGILWALMGTQDATAGPVPGMLRAFDALTLAELWNSNMNPADNAGLLSKFTLPTVADGKVFVATFSNLLNVYGLH